MSCKGFFVFEARHQGAQREPHRNTNGGSEVGFTRITSIELAMTLERGMRSVCGKYPVDCGRWHPESSNDRFGRQVVPHGVISRYGSTTGVPSASKADGPDPQSTR